MMICTHVWTTADASFELSPHPPRIVFFPSPTRRNPSLCSCTLYFLHSAFPFPSYFNASPPEPLVGIWFFFARPVPRPLTRISPVYLPPPVWRFRFPPARNRIFAGCPYLRVPFCPSHLSLGSPPFVFPFSLRVGVAPPKSDAIMRLYRFRAER